MKFLVSDGSRAVSRVIDSPEFFELIRRGDGTESELMSCVGLYWALSERAFEKFYVGANRLSMRRMAGACILHTHVLHYNRRSVDP